MSFIEINVLYLRKKLKTTSSNLSHPFALSPFQMIKTSISLFILSSPLATDPNKIIFSISSPNRFIT